jgi:hypothetical protein
MKESLTLTGASTNVMLLGVLSLVLLQACQPINTVVSVDCRAGESRGTDDGPGGPCQKTTALVGSAIKSNTLAVNTSNQPTNEQIPIGSKCDWTGGQNYNCSSPGAPSCSFYPNATCHDTYILSLKKCGCGCF